MAEKERSEEDNNKKQKEIVNIANTIANKEVVDRYGSANAEYIKSYNGDEGSRNLKKISNYNNSKEQKKGWSFENNENSKRNAEYIISKKKKRVKLSDDIEGKFNDEIYDIVEVDSKGNPLVGTGAQMKCMDSDVLVDNYTGAEKWEKYQDCDIIVPADQYDEILEKALKVQKKYEEKAKLAEKNGNSESAEKYRNKANRAKNLRKRIKKGKTTKIDAEFAANNPLLYTTKNIIEVSHRSGIEAAKSSFLIGGTISLSKNIVSLIKCEKEIDEALTDTIKDTVKSTKNGNVTTFSSSTLQVLLHT